MNPPHIVILETAGRTYLPVALSLALWPAFRYSSFLSSLSPSTELRSSSLGFNPVAADRIPAATMPEETFTPSPEFAAAANANDPAIYTEAARDPEKFWADWGRKLTWFHPFSKVSEFESPTDGRHRRGEVVPRRQAQRLLQLRRSPRAGARRTEARSSSRASRATTRTITYGELKREVERIANALKALGVEEGRPGRDLHADDSRAGDDDARLRPHRRGARRGLRRLHRRIASASVRTTRAQS